LRGLPSEAQLWSRVRYQQAGEGVWLSGSRWPPLDTTPLVLYLTADGTLSSGVPDPGQIGFAYNPDDPSLTVGGATLLPQYHYGPTDQGEVLARSDAVAFVSEPLDAPLRVQGAITASVDMRTTGFDTDLMVRLTDVDEAGNHLLLGDGARRLKLRDSFQNPSPTYPGERYSLVVELTNELAYTFAAGHRVGLIVSSSNYARFDRNPNNGDDFYREGTQAQSVTNTLFLDGSCALTLPRG
jgi:putative CocE/NonD family hydrolase